MTAPERASRFLNELGSSCRLPHARGEPSNTFTVLTSTGPAAIATIQICGPKVPEFVALHIRAMLPIRTECQPCVEARLVDLTPGGLKRGQFREASGDVLDDVLISVHSGPPAWELRVHLHGSSWLVRRSCELLNAAGFRQLETPSAPLWPAQDAIEAEAHALLPRMQTLVGARWLLEQARKLRQVVTELLRSEDWDSGRQTCRELAARRHIFDWFSRPARVALIGQPNAGKSTLANALAEQEVSLTSPQAGTTRDWVEIPAVVRGFPIVWLDTAGLRFGAEGLEASAVAKTRECARTADAVVLVLDGTATAAKVAHEAVDLCRDITPTVVVLNKLDRAEFSDKVRDSLPSAWHARLVTASAADGMNVSRVTDTVLLGLGRSAESAGAPGAFTDRQAQTLKDASEAIDNRYYRTVLDSCLSPNHYPPE